MGHIPGIWPVNPVLRVGGVVIFDAYQADSALTNAMALGGPSTCRENPTTAENMPVWGLSGMALRGIYGLEINDGHNCAQWNF
jgi:hypothetical protein